MCTWLVKDWPEVARGMSAQGQPPWAQLRLSRVDGSESGAVRNGTEIIEDWRVFAHLLHMGWCDRHSGLAEKLQKILKKPTGKAAANGPGGTLKS